MLLLLLLTAFELLKLEEARSKSASLREELLSEDVLVIPLNRVPQEWMRMLLVVEDPNFYSHKGIDVRTPGAGLTTITQALAKYLYFDGFKPGFQKIEQSLIARFVLNADFSKDEQLAIFLNTAYLGHVQGSAVKGFQDAAQTYYGKDFLALSEREFLSIVAMLVAPNSLNVKLHPSPNAERVERIYAVLNGSYRPTSVTDIFYDQEA